MSLKARITEDMKAAMRARDSQRLSAIRLLLAAIKQREVDERRDLSDADVLATIDKMVKQRRDSIAQFQAGGREDLARNEQFEVTLLQGYLPAALSDAELAQAVSDAIAASGAQGPQEMGKVMALLKARLAGRVDLSKVSAIVKARLA
ncbi:MAG: GatB/YqeY domain-containing protein [Burkholderiales bacterium]